MRNPESEVSSFSPYRHTCYFLPRLNELQSNRESASATLSCKSEAPRPSETLKGTSLTEPEWDRTSPANLTRAGGGIPQVKVGGLERDGRPSRTLRVRPCAVLVGRQKPWNFRTISNKATNTYNTVSVLRWCAPMR